MRTERSKAADQARSSGRISPSLAWIAAGVLFGFLLCLAFLHAAPQGGEGIWSRVTGFLTARGTRFHWEAPSVVEKIRQLNRLETVEYSVDKIVEGERESILWPDFLAGDKIILVAHGEVIAGVDLGQLKAGDVSVSGDTVRVRLPAAQLLTTRIDNRSTRVYSRPTGLLVNADPNLESEVRGKAEQQIAQAAISEGILDKARQNAKGGVAALLSGLGFRQVDVQ